MKETVLITGASSGIGFELARLFAQNGYKLVLVSRGNMPLDDLIATATKAHYRVDLSKATSAQELVAILRKNNISIDMLINNAGFGDYGEFKNADLGKLTEMMQLNVNTLTQLTHMLLPDILHSSSGKIMNVASIAAFLPGPYMAVYYATKHYVLAFSEGLAEELATESVSVTALCPGPTASGFQAIAGAADAPFFKGNIPTSAEVAHYGYDAMMSGKRVAIPKFKNKLTAFAVRFFPRNLVTKIVALSSR